MLPYLRAGRGTRKLGLLASRRRYSLTETTFDEESAFSTIREQLKKRPFLGADRVDLSPELREKVNAEFQTFLNEFVYDHKFQEELDSIAEDVYSNTGSIRDMLSAGSASAKDSSGNMSGTVRFPKLQMTEFDEPYSVQELYRRQLFHANNIQGIGATVADVYRPHEDTFKPPTIERTSIASLLAAGAHLGHSKALLRPNCLPFIYGEREGIHIIDLEQTLSYLRRAASVVQGVAERGGVILFVGTREGQEKSVEVAAGRAHGYYVHSRWTPGTLTNALNISGEWERVEVDLEDKPTGRELGPHLKEASVKPDLVVLLNPVENRNLLSECIAARVPTIGIVDTDSEPSLLSYPIPANDDSLRTCDLIVGVLSNAARRGRDIRLAEVSVHRRNVEKAKSGTGFNLIEDEEPPHSGGQVISHEEVAMARNATAKS